MSKRAKSKDLCERRIAIIATGQFILHGEYQQTFSIAEILLNDEHDLIHKAVGWMLREVSKRCSQEAEETFLKTLQDYTPNNVALCYRTVPRRKKTYLTM